MTTVLVQKNRASVARAVLSYVVTVFCIMCLCLCMRHCRADWVAEAFSCSYKYECKCRVIYSRFWVFAGLMFRISPFCDKRILTTSFSKILTWSWRIWLKMCGWRVWFHHACYCADHCQRSQFVFCRYAMFTAVVLPIMSISFNYLKCFLLLWRAFVLLKINFRTFHAWWCYFYVVLVEFFKFLQASTPPTC